MDNTIILDNLCRVFVYTSIVFVFGYYTGKFY